VQGFSAGESAKDGEENKREGGGDAWDGRGRSGRPVTLGMAGEICSDQVFGRGTTSGSVGRCAWFPASPPTTSATLSSGLPLPPHHPLLPLSCFPFFSYSDVPLFLFLLKKRKKKKRKSKYISF
jgi:hypothetical protein